MLNTLIIGLALASCGAPKEKKEPSRPKDPNPIVLVAEEAEEDASMRAVRLHKRYFRARKYF
jgi:hypothetical protein